MVLERAEVIIKDGMMDEFIEVLVSRALPLTKRFTGLISFEALRGVEDSNSMMLLATWTSIEAHLASRPEPAHAEFRSIVLPYTAGAKKTVHFSRVWTSEQIDAIAPSAQ
jgi:quinol monooxygenase YgiN